MFQMSNFKPNAGKSGSEGVAPGEPKVDTYDDVSHSMDVFQRTEEQFLPPGKDFEDLTEKELLHLKHQYRYDYYKPGVYQAITWLRKHRNHGL